LHEKQKYKVEFMKENMVPIRKVADVPSEYIANNMIVLELGRNGKPQA
jgi:hypothetical protein